MRPLFLALLISALGPALAQPAAPPSYVLHDAVVFTADPGTPTAQAVAVRGDRIVAVGSDEAVLALAGPETTVIDLDGRLLVPGLNDAHIHIGPWPAMRNVRLSGPDDPSWQTVLDSVGAAAAATPAGTWIAGEVGGAVMDDPAATRFALDAVAPEHPVRLVGFTGHGLLVNTAALHAMEIPDDAPDVPGGWYDRVDGGETLNGWVWEYAHMGLNARTSGALPRADAVETYRWLSGRMLGWGVTSVQHMENVRPPEETLAALAEADLPIRWTIYAMPSKIGSAGETPLPIARPDGLPERVRIAGTKWVFDGTPVERLAALRQPYSDRPEWSGRVNFTPAEVRAMLQAALDGSAGQVALHVVGDSTLALVLRTMNELAPSEAWRDRRLRIEHGDGTMPDLLPAMRDLGVILVQNPLHLAIPHVLTPRYGAERVPHVQLLRSAVEAGIPVALGADAGGSGRNPWLNLMLAAVHPVNPAEALTREQALVAFTRGGAFAEGMEHEKGTLAPGMLADLAVLSQNVLEVPPDALPATESMLTMIGGVIVHRAADFTGAVTPAPRAPLLHAIDHVWASAEEAENLLRFFRDSLGLPQAWPYRAWGDYESGGVSLGNVVLELASWEEPDATPVPTAFGGIAFEPVEHAAGVVAELERRGVPHSEPAVYGSTDASGREVGWTLIDFPDLSAWGASISDYHDRESISASRGRAHARLAEQDGGPLGVRALREIVLGAPDVDAARALWRRLIDAPEEETAPGVFAFGPGPAVRVVPGEASVIEGVVVEVRSLAAARAFLATRGWLGEGASGEVSIAPEVVGGLRVLLVEPFGSADRTQPEVPMLNKVEHFYATSENAEALFGLFRDSLGLAQVWDFQTWGDFASGGVSLGNVAFEFARWTPDDGSVLPTQFSGIAFEPVEHTDALLAELDRRGVPHAPPEVNTWWTNKLLHGEGMLPEPRSVFICDYADRALVAENRRQASEALRVAGGGPLGVVALREITLGVTDLDEARRGWRRLIDDPAQERDDVFSFGTGPSVRLVPAAEPGIPNVVIEVRSLQQARAFLRQRGWLSEGASGEVAIAPEVIGGLRVLLVEP